MPVKQITQKSPHSEEQVLIDRLVAEWRTVDSHAIQPIILEERNAPDNYVHVYVIWDDWAHLSFIKRSQVVMDAYEQRYGHDEMLKVTVAMGLTSLEAERLGIHA